MSTRVVSWNDAAEMNERVCSDALVMPSSIGCAVAGVEAEFCDALVLVFEIERFHRFPFQEFGVAGFHDLDLLQHLANDHLDVLVVDRHALQSIDLLDFLNEVIRQRFDAENGEDVLRRGVAVEQVIALLHEVAFLHRNVLALRDHVLDRLEAFVFRHNAQAALVLVVLAELDAAVAFRDDRVILRTARFEQFRHARQTARDVAGLGAARRHTREVLARRHFIAVGDRENGADRQRVGLHRHALARSSTEIDGFRSEPFAVERQSMTTFEEMPVASSNSSRAETPSMRSSNFTLPATSVRIGVA